jgi:CDP-glucose 4,6-dehydratase
VDEGEPAVENVVTPALSERSESKGYWRNRPVLVTGCTGFLGSWMVRVLLEQGAQVVGLIRDQVPQSPLSTRGDLGRITAIHGDITDGALVERVLGEYEIDTVLHLAAQAIVGVANQNPTATFETNIRGTWQVLEACRRVKSVRRIVVASSDKAYGDHEKLPYDETSPLQGKHPYDVSKSCADLIAAAYHHTYGLPVCITRCGNLFGGGDLNFNRVIPGTIRSVIFNEAPIIRSDGTFIRDYIYVLDAVYAYLLLAEKMDDSSLHGSAFNFSNEIQVDVLELVERILRAMNRGDLRPRVLNEVKAEIRHQYLSAARARSVLDWRPRYTLDEGLGETIAWYQDHFRSQPALSGAQA